MDLKKSIKIINTDSFFIDYIKVNWQLPIKELSQKDFQKTKYYHKEIFNILNASIKVFRENYKCCEGLMVLIDEHYNVQIDFKGAFFINTTKYNLDIDTFYKWYLEFNNIIMYHWADMGIGKGIRSFKIPRATIARLDLATQKNSTFLKEFIPIVTSRGIDLVNSFNMPFDQFPKNDLEKLKKLKINVKGKFYCTGITIAPEIGYKTQNIFFRAYDKRFATKSAQTCFKRFKTLELIRKEWMIKSRFLRAHGITTPEDLMSLCNNKKMMTIFIKKIRLSKDVILHNDNKLYKSLHDEKFRKEVFSGTDISLKDFNEIYKMKYNVFLKKAKKEDINKLLYNPYKHLKGLLKYINNMSKEEYLDFQKSLLESMQKEMYKSYHPQLPRDFDQEYYNKIEKMLLLLKEMGKVKSEVKVDFKLDNFKIQKMVARS